MNIKKILAITIIVLAVFSCMNAASAGLFDFLGGGEVKNATFTFDGFTLDLPENANITNDTSNDDGMIVKSFDIEWTNGGDENNKTSLYVDTSVGGNLVPNADEYVNNWVKEGAKAEGKYGDWSIVNVDGVRNKAFDDLNLSFNVTYSGYILAQMKDSKLILMKGNDLNQLERIADTYKEI